jgi:DNA-binding PadR family transcriptional regulator
MRKNKKHKTFQQKVDGLTSHFRKSIKNGFGSMIILYSINKRGSASSKEIQQDMEETFSSNLEYRYTSFYRLLSRLRDEFYLIEESHRESSNGPDRIYYQLTKLGEEVFNNIMEMFINPLSKICEPN